MIFFNPIMSILLIYVLAAVLPAFFLLRYIYKRDMVEKEPGYLLWALLLAGVLAALASIVLENIGSGLIDGHRTCVGGGVCTLLSNMQLERLKMKLLFVAHNRYIF